MSDKFSGSSGGLCLCVCHDPVIILCRSQLKNHGNILVFVQLSLESRLSVPDFVSPKL